MKPVQVSVADAAKVIAAAPALAITGHVSPDGDALGSALALAHASRGAGKPAVVSFGSPFGLPASLAFLDVDPVVPPGEFPAAPECLVVMDAGSADRLAELGSAAAAAEKVVVVDHHRSTTGEFGDVLVVDPEAAATAQLTLLLIDTLEWEITPTVATCLLTGIVTDTGRFQYAATNGDVMRSAARLLDAGARAEVIGQHVYESVPFGYLHVSAAMLGRSILDDEAGLVWSWIEEADVDAAGVTYGDVDGLIDDLRIAREAGVAALLKEVEGGWKVSLRSRGEVDVGAIAESHGGGGHHNAAGFTAEGDREQVIGLVEAGLRG